LKKEGRREADARRPISKNPSCQEGILRLQPRSYPELPPRSNRAIRAELHESNLCRCDAFGIEARSVLAMCRALVAQGCDPESTLAAYRGRTLCLAIKTIGTAARLEVNTKGTGFVRAPAVRTAPPMRRLGKPGPEAGEGGPA
jgi:hypothetical protein